MPPADLGGVLDFTGELGRLAIAQATRRDEAAVQRNAAGQATTMFDTAADILLGGGGSDVIEGRAGNDIIDGDRWLNVRLKVSDAFGVQIGSADDLGGIVRDAAGNALFGGRALNDLMLDRTLNPGQLSIVREILDGKHDDLPEQAFYMVGTIEEAREKSKTL